MKEQAITLRPHEVRGILSGDQTELRRVIKPQPKYFVGGTVTPRAECDRLLLRWTKGVPYKPARKKPTKNGQIWEEDNGERFEPIPCPYGQPDDRLWVKETWGVQGGRIVYRADGLRGFKGGWKPPLSMPRAASRIILTITDIRSEQSEGVSEWVVTVKARISPPNAAYTLKAVGFPQPEPAIGQFWHLGENLKWVQSHSLERPGYFNMPTIGSQFAASFSPQEIAEFMAFSPADEDILKAIPGVSVWYEAEQKVFICAVAGVLGETLLSRNELLSEALAAAYALSCLSS